MKKYIYILIFCTVGCVTTSIDAEQNSSDGSDILKKVLSEYDDLNDEETQILRTQWSIGSKQRNRKIKQYTHWLSQLQSIDKTELSSQDVITMDFLELVFGNEVALESLDAHLMPLNSEGGFLTNMFYSNQYLLLYDGERMDNYSKKLKAVSDYIDEQIAYLEEGLEQHIVVPKLVAQNALSILENQLSTSDSLHFLMRPIFRTEDDDYIRQCLQLFKDKIKPSFERLGNFLRSEYIPRTRSAAGISNNQNGKAFYEQRVQYFTTLDMTPGEVFEIGKAEVARIKKEMEAIIDSLEFEGDFDDFFEFLRTDEQFYAKTGKQLLQEAAWLSKKAEEFLPRYFEELPRLPFTVKAVPEDIAPTYTAGRYSGGSYKQARAGSYWVNTYDLPSRPLYALPALTLHEAVPGHHLQGSLAQEMKNVPKIRTSTYISAFGEGWALYCEFLGKEAGYYQSLYDEFGRLTYEMWRACRLVVDPGIHYFNWTREEAVEFMAANTALSIHEVNTEIDRYIGWPGQAVSYKIGELKIRELRKRSEEALGEDFDVRKFHDVILENGSVPLSTLENLVDQYINDK